MALFNPFKKSYTNSELAKFRFLNKISLFSKLNFDELNNFLPIMHLRDYKYEEAVFFRGDPSHALYIVHRGSVNLNIDIKDKFQPLVTLKKGHAFGENSLIHDSRRIYNAIVGSEKAELYVIPHVNIYEVFDHHPKIKAKMMESLSEDYNQYMQKLFTAYKSSFGFFDIAQVYE